MVILTSGNMYSQTEGIVGGEEVEEEQFPWMGKTSASDFLYGCSTTLIEKQWALTAAHCVDSYNFESPAPYRVYLNLTELNMFDPESYTEEIFMDGVFMHEDYDPMSNDGPDLALIRLSAPSVIEPIQLATYEDVASFEHEDDAMVLGWGITELGGEMVDKLRLAECKFVDNDTCESMYELGPYNYYAHNPGGNICAGYFEGEIPVGAAIGDSGGPLFFKDIIGDFKQVGIVSGGETTITTAEFPGVFTLIPEYIDWIHNTMDAYEVAHLNDYRVEEDLSIAYIGDSRIKIIGLYGSYSYKIELYDVMGNKLGDSQCIQNNVVELSIGVCAQGIYVVRVLNENTGVVTTEKISIVN